MVDRIEAKDGTLFKLVRLKVESSNGTELVDNKHVYRVIKDDDKGVAELYGIKDGVTSVISIRGYISLEIYGERF